MDKQVPIACVGQVIEGLKWDDKRILNDLKENIERYNISIALAFVDPAISVISELKKVCPNVFIPVSDSSLCNIMFDKLLSVNWFKEKGISQPDFYTTPETFIYPVILKPRGGSASKGIIVCKSIEESPPIDLHAYLVQNYITNHTEYSVDCYVSRNGVVTSVVPRVRLETLGGEVVRSKTVKDGVIIELSKKILSSGDFRGPITIQYIKDNTTGKINVMEINPRLGGGVVTSIGACSGIISMILDESLGNDINPVTDWKDNTIMVRYFNEVIFYADNN
ncbi:MAG: ATP-grasp domain-containing protein [Bacteroides sp.]|nr:ATP-grasp domain-containing protein [Bacteroides sp.]